MEFIEGPNAYRHFLVMSNELSTPWVLTCPADVRENHLLANTFGTPDNEDEVKFMSNSNLSYFVGIDARDANPSIMLSGDCYITNGLAPQNGILGLTTNNPGGWTSDLHHGSGNIALADGSVQQLATVHLRMTVTNTGVATNRLQMPVLTP